jgi:hypothetical protein
MNVTALVARMPFQTRHFNVGQKVWLVRLGRGAAEVAGMYRQQGPLVRAWVNWGHAGRAELDFKPCEVDAAFAGRTGIITKESLNAR